MVSFDTNVLVYASAAIGDVKAVRARDLLTRGMRTAKSVLLLQTLAEFSNVALRKAKIPVDDIQTMIDGWRAVMPVQAADQDDLLAALETVKTHGLSLWDAMQWASARRAGVRHLLTEDFQDGLALHGVMFVNPFRQANDRLIDTDVLPQSSAG